jgi:hypothetical protein
MSDKLTILADDNPRTFDIDIVAKVLEHSFNTAYPRRDVH